MDIKSSLLRYFSWFFIPFLLMCISSCSLVEKVKESTTAIDKNRRAVELSTRAIQENEQVVERGNEVIRENEQIVSSNNPIIAQNRVLIEKANAAIRANEHIISMSTETIRENVAAVKLSSAMIRENAKAIQDATNLMSSLKVSPSMAGFIGLVLLIALFIIPILMVIFMIRIRNDIRALQRR